MHCGPLHERRGAVDLFELGGDPAAGNDNVRHVNGARERGSKPRDGETALRCAGAQAVVGVGTQLDLRGHAPLVVEVDDEVDVVGIDGRAHAHPDRPVHEQAGSCGHDHAAGARHRGRVGIRIELAHGVDECHAVARELTLDALDQLVGDRNAIHHHSALRIAQSGRDRDQGAAGSRSG